MKKRLLSCLLAVVMVVSSITPMNVKASEVPAAEEEQVQVEEAEVVDEESEEVSSEEPVVEEPVSEEPEVEEQASVETEKVEKVAEKETKTLNNAPDVSEVSEEESVSIESIEVNEVHLIENLQDEYVTTDVEGESVHWYKYDTDVLNANVCFTDGNVGYIEDGYLVYDENRYEVTYTDNQSYENQWEAGKHTATLSVLGFEADYSVYIDKMESFTFQNQEYTYGVDGHARSDSEDEPIYWYFPINYSGELVVTNFESEENESIEIDGESFWYGEKEYRIEYRDNQSASEPWKVGDHTVDVSIGDYKTEFVVTIKTLIKDVQIAPVEFTYGIGGWYQTDENNENRYYHFPIGERLQYTVTLYDGQVIESQGNYVQIDTEEGSYGFELEYDFEQNHENQLLVGETTINASLAGYDTSFDVTVHESPVERIYTENDTYSIMEYTNGRYEVDEESKEKYYFYDYGQTITIVMKNGDVFEGELEYDGDYYSPSYYSNPEQSAQTPWEAGNTYPVTVEFMGVTCTYEVEITESPFARVEFDNLELIEGSQSIERDDEEEPYYVYNPRTTFTLYYKDETLEPLVSDTDGSVWYEEEWIYMDFEDDQTSLNTWEVGSEHTVTGSIFGLTGEYSVSIVENPIERVEFEPLTLIEGTQNRICYEYDEDENEFEWKAYNPRTQFTVYFSDEDREPVTSDIYGEIRIDGEYYSMEFEDSQSYSEQWEVGKDYTVTGFIFGYSAEYTVSIVESPIEFIEFEPVHLYENADGCYEEDENGEWFRYEYYPQEYVVTFKDGSTQVGEDSAFEYDGRWYELSIIDTQEKNHWGLGEHEATVTLFGHNYSMPVVIEAFPIQSISVEPLKIIEGCNVTYRKGVDDDNEEYAYFHYEMGMNPYGDCVCPAYTITMEDGTKIESDYLWFEYGGRDYSVDISHTQGPKTPWLPGNTYKATLAIGGFEEEFDVIIEESPIESITFEPVENIIETNGWWDEYWDPETDEWIPYFNYDLYDIKPHYTVKMTNGAVIKGSGFGFMYKGMYYEMTELNLQGRDNQWNTSPEGNDVEVMLMGKTGTLNVKLIDMPYESMEILNVQPVGKENSWWDYNEDDEKVLMYDVPEFSFKLNYKNSDEYVIGFSSNAEYNLAVDDGQYEKPWTVDGDNTFTVEYLGLKATGHVEVKADADYDYIESNGEIYITGSGIKDEEREIPSVIDGKPVVGILSLDNVEGTIKKLTIPDSVRMIGESVYLWNLRELHIGSGLEKFNTNLFDGELIETITISEDNPYYCAVDNVIYDKEMTTVIYYPLSNGLTFEVPASVTNIDIFNQPMYDEVILEFSDESDAFTTSDDGYVVYNKDKTKIISCSPEISGTYEMPETVTEIADSAFIGCKNLTGVKVSSGVTAISYAAFYDCSSLASVEMPNTVTTIGDGAFTHTALTNVDLSDELTSIGQSAFSRTKLSSIVIPDKVETIGDNAFFKTNIASVTIPDSVTSIGLNTFTNCDNLTDVTVGAGVDYIPIGAFEDTDNLKNVTFKNKNVAIDDFAFNDSGVKNVNLANTADIIGFSSFANSGLEKAELEGSSVAQISYTAFMNCSNLDTVTMPTTIRSIAAGSFDYTKAVDKVTDGAIYLDEEVLYTYRGLADEGTVVTVEDGTLVLADSAFENQSGIAEVILPEGLLTIGKGTFLDCTGLTSINIPASVEYIDPTAFIGCTSLTDISIDSANEMYSSGPNGEILSKDGTRLIWCPPVVGKDYYTVPAGIAAIEENAFGCIGVNHIYVGSDVEIADRGIGYDGYYKSMVTIHCEEDSPAYKYAKANLLDVAPACEHTWDDGVETKAPTLTTPGEKLHTCTACGATKTEEIKATGNAFGENLIWSYDEESEILTIAGTGAIPDLSSSDDYPWYEYKNTVKELVIEEGITVICEHAFGGYWELSKVTFPDGLETIDAYAFITCTKLEEVTIPASVKEIGEYAFDGCQELSKVTFADGLETIGECAFRGCEKLEEVTIPASVKEIGHEAFAGCSTGEIKLYGLINSAAEMYVADNYADFSPNGGSIEDCILEMESEHYGYTGSELKPEVKIITPLSETELIEGVHYTEAQYSNNINPGTATVTVSGIAPLTGTISGTFEIRKATLVSLSRTVFEDDDEYINTGSSLCYSVEYVNADDEGPKKINVVFKNIENDTAITLLYDGWGNVNATLDVANIDEETGDIARLPKGTYKLESIDIISRPGEQDSITSHYEFTYNENGDIVLPEGLDAEISDYEFTVVGMDHTWPKLVSFERIIPADDNAALYKDSELTFSINYKDAGPRGLSEMLMAFKNIENDTRIYFYGNGESGIDAGTLTTMLNQDELTVGTYRLETLELHENGGDENHYTFSYDEDGHILMPEGLDAEISDYEFTVSEGSEAALNYDDVKVKSIEVDKKHVVTGGAVVVDVTLYNPTEDIITVYPDKLSVTWYEHLSENNYSVMNAYGSGSSFDLKAGEERTLQIEYTLQAWDGTGEREFANLRYGDVDSHIIIYTLGNGEIIGYDEDNHEVDTIPYAGEADICILTEEEVAVVTGVSIDNEDAITSGGTVSGNLTLKEDIEFKYITLEFYNEEANSYMYVKANNLATSAFNAKTPAFVVPGEYQLKAITYETAYGIVNSYICDGSETVTINAPKGTTVIDNSSENLGTEVTSAVQNAEEGEKVAIVASVGEQVTMSSVALQDAKDKGVELVLADNTGQGEIVIQPTETMTEYEEEVQISFVVSENTSSEDEPEATEEMGVDAFNSVTISMNQTDIPVTVRVKTEEPVEGTNFYLFSKDAEGKIQIVQRDLTYNEAGYVEISFVNGIGNAAASPIAMFANLRASRSVQNVEYYLGSRLETEECKHTSGNNYTKIVDATCKETGYKTYKCLYCGVENQESLSATGHKKETVPAVAATCKETGLTEGKKCSVCGEVLEAQEVVPVIAHTEETVPAVAATCKETGLTEGKKCSVCGDVLVAQEVVPANGHTEVTDAAVAATCTTAGKTVGKHCSVCGEVIEAQEVVPANGHTEVTDAAVAATCTTAGKTAGKHCSVCGEVITAQKVVAAKGHSYGSWITSKAASCTAAGSRYKVCACGDKVTETIKAVGHNYKVTKTTKATTKKNGKLEKQCKVCKAKATETLYRAKTVSLSKTKFVYNGKTQKPTVVVKDSKGKAISSSNYKVSFSKGCKNVGTYKVTVKFKGQYSGTLTKTFKITKAKPKITASNFTKKVGDKAFSIKAKISPNGGKVTYKTSNKKIATVSSKGKVTIKKAGKVTITITSAANKNCSKVTKKITVNVKKK